MSTLLPPSDNSNSPSGLSWFFSRFSSTSREKSSTRISTSTPTSEKSIEDREVGHPTEKTQPKASFFSRISSSFLSFVLSALSIAKILFSRSVAASLDGKPMVEKFSNSESQTLPITYPQTLIANSSTSNQTFSSETPITRSKQSTITDTSPQSTLSTSSSTSFPSIKESSSETSREEPIHQEIEFNTPPQSISSSSSKTGLSNETKASSGSITSFYNVPSDYNYNAMNNISGSNAYPETFKLNAYHSREKKEEKPASYSELTPQKRSEQKHLTEIAILNNKINIEKNESNIKAYENNLNELNRIPPGQQNLFVKKEISSLETKIRVKKMSIESWKNEISKLEETRLDVLKNLSSDPELDKNLKVQRLEVLKVEKKKQIENEKNNVKQLKIKLDRGKISTPQEKLELENSIKYYEGKLQDMEIEFDKVDIEQMELQSEIMEEKNTTAKASESKTNSDGNTLKIDEKTIPGDAIGSKTVESSPTAETSPSDQTAVSSSSTESILEDSDNLEQASVTEDPLSSNVESSNVTEPAIEPQSSEAASINTEVSEENAKPKSADTASELKNEGE